MRRIRADVAGLASGGIGGHHVVFSVLVLVFEEGVPVYPVVGGDCLEYVLKAKVGTVTQEAEWPGIAGLLHVVYVYPTGSVKLAGNVGQCVAGTGAHSVSVVPVKILLDEAIKNSCGVHATHPASLHNDRGFFHLAIVPQESVHAKRGLPPVLLFGASGSFGRSDWCPALTFSTGMRQMCLQKIASIY